MAKKTTAKAEEIEQTENQVVEETLATEEEIAPVVAAGDHFKTVKVRFKRTICAEYGTFYQGEVGTVALYIANELEKCGAGEIVKE